MANRNHPFVGLFVGLLAYGALLLAGFAGTAFILGTGDFSEWGIGGRAAALVAGAVLVYLGALPLEIFEMRKRMAEGLIQVLERNDA